MWSGEVELMPGAKPMTWHVTCRSSLDLPEALQNWIGHAIRMQIFVKSVSCVILNLGLSERKTALSWIVLGIFFWYYGLRKGGSIFLYLVPLLYIDGMQYSSSSKCWLDISVCVLSATWTSRWSRLIVVFHLSRIHVIENTCFSCYLHSWQGTPETI